jgi:hypothetical protein
MRCTTVVCEPPHPTSNSGSKARIRRMAARISEQLRE